MNNNKSDQITTFEIEIPVELDSTQPATARLFKAFLKLRIVFSVGILTTDSRMSFIWSVPYKQKKLALRLLRAHWPQGQIRQINVQAIYQENRVFNPNWLIYKFRCFQNEGVTEDSDALSYLTTVFSKIKKNEVLIYQIRIKPIKFRWSDLVQKTINWFREISISENQIKNFKQNKKPQSFFKTEIRFSVSSPKDSRYLTSLKIALSLFESKRSITKLKKNSLKLEKRFFTNQPLKKIGLKSYLTTNQLANLFHFPSAKFSSIEKSPRFLSQRLPPIGSQSQPLAIEIGVNYHQKSIVPVGLTKIQRQRHVYVVGGTGCGKTTLLSFKILQDIKNNQALAVIDPHGDLAELILRKVPDHRRQDVIYFNPANYSQPQPGIDLLAVPSGLKGDDLEQAKDLVTENVVSILKKVFSSGSAQYESGHRIEYILRNTVQTALTLENPTLFTLFQLLNDRSFNRKVTTKLENPYLKMFWKEEVNKAGSFQRVKMQAGVTSKIGRFLFSTSIKKVFVSQNNLDFGSLMNQKKILICNFSKGILGEDASRLLGATVLAKIQLAALKRAIEPEFKRKSFYLYVDEFQNFATSSFVEMLSEARKYGLYLIMAEQSTQQQVDSRLIEIILANTGTVIVFRSGSPKDAQLLSPLFKPFLSQIDLMNLDAFNFYLKSSGLKNQLPTSGKTVVL